MANSIPVIDKVTNELQRFFHNNTAFTGTVDRQYDPNFAQEGAKIGNTLRIKQPARHLVRSGASLSTDDHIEPTVTLTVDQQKHIDTTFTTEEMTMDFDGFSKRILKPAGARLASQVDFDGMTQYQNVYNSVGTPGTAVVFNVGIDGGVKLDDGATPRDGDRYLTLSPTDQGAVVKDTKGLFQKSDSIGAQYASGEMGTAGGFIWGMDQNTNRHTTGGFAGTTLVDDTVTEGDEVMTVDAFTDAAPTINKGDIFTVAGVNSVNPETGQDTGKLAQFVCTADTTGSTNEANIPLSPALLASATNPQRTITALPADGAAVTFLGTAATAYPQNLAYHREAFTLGTADLVMPAGVDMASRNNFEGVSMRVVRQYTIASDALPARIDILYGWLTQRKEFATRVWG